MKNTSKKLEGFVVGSKANKTVSVLVERKVSHPLYKKYISKSKKFNVHSDIEVEVGSKVIIEECTPISKTKTWKVIKVN